MRGRGGVTPPVTAFDTGSLLAEDAVAYMRYRTLKGPAVSPDHAHTKKLRS